MSKKHYIIPIFVPHEGCPHNCVFCNQDKITGEDQKVTGEYVKDTIEEYLKTIEREDSTTIEVSFFGGTFTAINIDKQRELLKVAKEYKDKGKIDYIRLSTRPDYIDDFILNHLKDYGVNIIELGIQSLDEDVLLKSGRGHSKEDVKKASKLIKDYGFVLGHQIMLGLPGDTFEKDIETVKKSIEMKPEICRIYPALVIKDTPMETMFNRGEYRPYTLEESIEITKKIYDMYLEKDIKVIRIGLQPTDTINEGGDIVEGPFHPAYRELVEGSMLNERIYSNIKNSTGKIILKVNPKTISKLYTNKKLYFNNLCKRINEKVKLRVIQDKEIKKDTIVIIDSDKNYTVNI